MCFQGGGRKGLNYLNLKLLAYIPLKILFREFIPILLILLRKTCLPNGDSNHWKQIAMTNLDTILQSRDITLPTKVHIVKTMLFPIIIYRWDSWTINKTETSSHSCVWFFEIPWTVASPGSSVHGILQARIMEWVAIPFSRGSSQPRDRTWVSCISSRFFTNWATREVSKKAEYQRIDAFGFLKSAFLMLTL